MENSVAFLASDIGRLFRKRLELTMRDLGVTGPQWRALARIAAQPGINQGTLASLLEVEAITAGRMVDRLEKLHLVERRPDPTDRRVWLLHLTPQAEPLIATLRERATVALGEVTAIFTDSELSQLVSLMKRLREHLLLPGCEAVEALADG